MKKFTTLLLVKVKKKLYYSMVHLISRLCFLSQIDKFDWSFLLDYSVVIY